jgi:hypothetical protein
MTPQTRWTKGTEKTSGAEDGVDEKSELKRNKGKQKATIYESQITD